MTDYAAILIREIRAIRPDARDVAITFNDDETITAVVDTHAYTCEISSDDDEFLFVRNDDFTFVLRFPIPDDYLE